MKFSVEFVCLGDPRCGTPHPVRCSSGPYRAVSILETRVRGYPSIAFGLEPTTLAMTSRLEHTAVVYQQVEGRCVGNVASKGLAQIPEFFGGSDHCAAPFGADLNQGEEGAGRLAAIGPNAGLVHHGRLEAM